MDKNILNKITIFTILMFLILPFYSCAENEHANNFEIYEISNNTDKYTVKYKIRDGMPDDIINFQIYHEDNIILNYSTDYKNKCFPNKLLYLFSHENADYYYMSTDLYEYIFVSSEIKNGDNLMGIDVIHNDKDAYNEEYKTISNIMKDKLDKKDLIDMFQKNGYSYDKIIGLYDGLYELT